MYLFLIRLFGEGDGGAGPERTGDLIRHMEIKDRTWDQLSIMSRPSLFFEKQNNTKM